MSFATPYTRKAGVVLAEKGLEFAEQLLTKRVLSAPIRLSARSALDRDRAFAPDGVWHLNGAHQRILKHAQRNVDIFPYGNILMRMARAATTSDAFNAIAEPQRRMILMLLKGRECAVNDVARALRIAQPRASKHLHVLREVGLVRFRKAGQERRYSLDARGLKPIHEWVGGFQQFWNEGFGRLDAYVRELQKTEE